VASRTRLGSWFCPGIKEIIMFILPPRWLLRVTLPGVIQDNFSEKSLSCGCSFLLPLGESLLHLIIGCCWVWLELDFLGFLSSLAGVTSLTALYHNTLVHMFPHCILAILELVIFLALVQVTWCWQ
jgi:hypothetical protein